MRFSQTYYVKITNYTPYSVYAGFTYQRCSFCWATLLLSHIKASHYFAYFTYYISWLTTLPNYQKINDQVLHKQTHKHLFIRKNLLGKIISSQKLHQHMILCWKKNPKPNTYNRIQIQCSESLNACITNFLKIYWNRYL